MSGRLDGHVALVTGAGGGIGGAIARSFEAEGCRVLAVDLSPPTCGSEALACDLGEEAAIDALAATLARRAIVPSIVVHAAAIGDRRASEATDAAFLQRMFAVNVGAAVKLAALFGREMRARRRGNFLFLSSVNSTFATPGLAAYAASKAAIDSLTRTLALEFAPDNVRVNAIRPASIDTPLLQRSFDGTEDAAAARQANIARHPLGRLGTPEDVAALALFLCSDEASWITGVDYLIDGGAAITRR
ncbi:NAD(P)-dependent dehydrogenase (short-subunit alcohol dehydrogenase family) [Sphingomonas zeicaulis]|uniref:SDR family NAD(P)-dependent oxidoreductase n=1 Tax=Sphingomonas zeicaulis TaxID=1632740 RepID=UPI003D1E817C